MADRRSDEQLVLATLAGDREAFGELVARHRDSVFALANRRLRDFHAAGDATQEAFLKAYRSLADLRDPARFDAWVRRIAERVVLSEARRPQREIPTDGLKPYDERLTDADFLEQVELNKRVREGLAALSGPTRRAVLLYHISGYSHAEVADRLGLTPSAVKTRLSRARRRLRKKRIAKVRRRTSTGVQR
ncbi:MAG: sigma-70 family RNA polymerase sigma factor [Armatimonadota bacterium]|nr:MAG: sigma-70 family RNA polymerase sigma factor [Armatimonadota bacterium]